MSISVLYNNITLCLLYFVVSDKEFGSWKTSPVYKPVKKDT